MRKIPKGISVEEMLDELCALHSNDFPARNGERPHASAKYYRCAAKDKLLRDYPTLRYVGGVDWAEIDNK